MRAHRPTSVLVLAIFHFILGGLGILLGLIGIGSGLMVYSIVAKAPPPPGTAGPAAFAPAAQYQYLDAHVPYWKEIDLATAAVSLVISVLMIVAGVGLLQMKPWGRTLSLVYGVTSILYQLGRFLYVILFFAPAMSAYFDSVMASGPGGGAPPPAFGAMMKTIMIGSPILGLIGLAYPIIVLALLLRPSAAAAFRGEPAGPEDFGDRYGRGGREDDYGRYPADYGQEPPGYGREPDDRIGPAPQ